MLEVFQDDTSYVPIETSVVGIKRQFMDIHVKTSLMTDYQLR